MTSLLQEHVVTGDVPTKSKKGNPFTALAAALQFLTVIPPLLRRPFAPQELGRSVGWFPAVGLLLGGCLAGLNWCLASVFSSGISAAIVLAAWVLGTGALHLDGFLDSCDGLFGGHTPEARLRIMRDERAGAFAVVGGVLLLLLKYAALVDNPERLVALLLAPVVGRWGMVLVLIGFPYARAEGLGRAMKDHAGWVQAVLATAVTAATAAGAGLIPGGWRGLAVLPIAALITWAVARLVLRRLPGLTGDVYGALCELLETLVLLAFVAGGNHVA